MKEIEKINDAIKSFEERQCLTMADETALAALRTMKWCEKYLVLNKEIMDKFSSYLKGATSDKK